MKYKAKIIGAIAGATVLYFFGAPLLLLSPQSFPHNSYPIVFLYEAVIGLVFGLVLALIYGRNKIFFYGTTVGAIIGLLAGISLSITSMTLWGAMPIFKILSWVSYPLSLALLPLNSLFTYIGNTAGGQTAEALGFLFAFYAIVPFLILIGSLYGAIVALIINIIKIKIIK